MSVFESLVLRISRKSRSSLDKLEVELKESSEGLAKLGDLTHKLNEAEAAKIATIKLLDQERQQLIAIFEGIDQPIFVCHADTKELIYYNDALEAISEESASGQTCHELIHGLEGPCDGCLNCPHTPESTRDRYSEVSQRWYHVIHKCIEWPNSPSHPAIFGLMIDITERKEAQLSLQLERDRVKEYLDIVGVIVLVIDLDQEVTLINKKGSALLGYPVEEIIGKNWFDYFIPERIRETVREAFVELINGNTEFAAQYENPIVNRSGKEFSIRWNNVLLSDDGSTIVGTLSAGEDITPLSDAELAYKCLIEYSLQGLAILNSTGIIFCNHELEKMLDRSCDDIYADSLSEFLDRVDAVDRERVTDEIEQLLASTSMSFRGKMHYNRSLEDQRIFEIYSRGILFKEENAIQIAFRDATNDNIEK